MSLKEKLQTIVEEKKKIAEVISELGYTVPKFTGFGTALQEANDSIRNRLDTISPLVPTVKTLSAGLDYPAVTAGKFYNLRG